MRRRLQETTDEVAMTWLAQAQTGILALQDEMQGIYQVPLNFVVMDGKIYFHCAKVGWKVDCMKACSQVSFCIIEEDRVIPETFSTHYGSVTLNGISHFVEDSHEKREALIALCDKYAPQYPELAQKEIDMSIEHTLIVSIEIKNISAKVSKGRIQDVEMKYTK